MSIGISPIRPLIDPDALHTNFLSLSRKHGQNNSLVGSVHSTEGGHSPARVKAVTEAMAQHDVRLISDYLKDYIFAVHRQPMKSVPRNVSLAELKKIEQHNVGAARNNRQLDDIADSRARILQRQGETLSDIADTLAKAEKFDRLASRSSSAFRAIPFASATILQYAKPEISKGNWLPTSLKPLAPLISGALSGVMDQVGTGVMNRVTGDAHYLTAAPEKLHDAMADSLKRNAPGLRQKSVDMGVAIQGYTARNLLRTGVATMLAGHPAVQAAVDTSIAAVGGLAANAVYGDRMHTSEGRDLQRGGAYIFGRKDAEPKALDDEIDWLDAYKNIKNATYMGAAVNASKRLAGMPIDILTDSIPAARSLISVSSLAQNGLSLSGGFAGAAKLQEMAAKNINNPYLKTAVSQLTNTVVSAAVFSSWTTAGVVTDPATRRAEQFLQHELKDAFSAAGSYMVNKVTGGLGVTNSLFGDTTNQGVAIGAASRAQYDKA
ncbi:type III effector [Pseudomonas sp. FP1740]|uniref:type III effector n=1 Tax=Pseudomonas sp. FP1740 TaxID=2954078 RepID=UPI002732ACFC|nr:type III effector [Pseudomonas sp. FP1740]WLG46839.1 type III effector [Pseudomonas sp. FP1740]